MADLRQQAARLREASALNIDYGSRVLCVHHSDGSMVRHAFEDSQPVIWQARGPVQVIEGHGHANVHESYACAQCNPPQPVRDPQPPETGTFFWPGLAEEEIRKERASSEE